MKYQKIFSTKDEITTICHYLILSCLSVFMMTSRVSGQNINDTTTGVSQLLTSILWTEERQAILKPEDPKTLYPRERHCEPPEITEPKEANRHDDTPWSPLFSLYTLDGGEELEAWRSNQESNQATSWESQPSTQFDVVLPLLLFPICFAIFLCVCVIIIPIFGAVGFRIIEVIWYLITHPEVRRLGRRTLILWEKMIRARDRMILPRGVEKPPKRLFYLPPYFRIHTAEDVPEELVESDDDQEVWLTPVGAEWHKNEREDDGDAPKKAKVDVSLSGLRINEGAKLN